MYHLFLRDSAVQDMASEVMMLEYIFVVVLSSMQLYDVSIGQDHQVVDENHRRRSGLVATKHCQSQKVQRPHISLFMY